MTDNELLLAISEIMDKKIKASIQPIKNDMNARFGKIENDLRTIKVDLLENNVLPRLSSMEQHYVLTANRYINSTESMESMESDLVVVKKVLREHSEKLIKIS